ncbi:MAG TPA: EF-hand domain-containing protein [Polyangiaceae bacterium]|jgi:Ca2+-binding EF-hand superfamily protein|nr:MAG: transaldolase/EF-hand domain-containing protein [Deltaproteobacteria bacterium ADurb.Bin207]HNS96058.1 EF-hand domain-containing protein [Polyangiaceae bacterium]HNZ20938.1 EF-hand domain-containing protein [Polyangiaceae bacterium]HOD24033.1 EF-hand domain-containing protein [Polyangiaceae bacterium]HOE47619.1 EF-hand domain-containing protein [Polyangiaceae bacterium]
MDRIRVVGWAMGFGMGLVMLACNGGPQDVENVSQAAEPLGSEMKPELRKAPGRPGVYGLALEADKNGDGKVTEAEFLGAVENRFQNLDSDGDGFLEGTECLGRMQDMPGSSRGMRRGMPMMRRMDKDGDGKISKSEYVQGHKELFETMAEGSGVLSIDKIWQEGNGRAGFGHGMGPRMRGRDRFGQLDTNGDDKVTKAEAEAGHALRFQQMDKNQDGVIDADEMKAYREAKMPGFGRHTGRWTRMDTDGDGKVTKAEFDRWHTEMFQRWDENGDGEVSLEEFGAHRPMAGPGRAR